MQTNQGRIECDEELENVITIKSHKSICLWDNCIAGVGKSLLEIKDKINYSNDVSMNIY